MEFEERFARGAYKDMVKAIKLLHDPTGIKVNILRFIEKILAYKMEYSSVIYQKTNNLIDYMNCRKMHWVHPCNKDEIFNSSFYELYEDGVKDGSTMITKASEYLLGSLDRSELESAFPNLSYLTGKFIHENNEIKYFKPIFG
jgi:hypothetical protein